MNKSTIKNSIESIKGKLIHFKYNGSRNQIEEFDGIIESTYNAVFTIKNVNNNELKSFTYNDISRNYSKSL